MMKTWIPRRIARRFFSIWPIHAMLSRGTTTTLSPGLSIGTPPILIQDAGIVLTIRKG